jgi:hypothetical protein
MSMFGCKDHHYSVYTSAAEARTARSNDSRLQGFRVVTDDDVIFGLVWSGLIPLQCNAKLERTNTVIDISW